MLGFIRAEERGVQFMLGSQLKFTFSVRRALPDEPDSSAAGIGRLHDTDEELLEEFFAAQLFFAQCRNLFNETLDSRACGLDTLLLCHEVGRGK